MRIVLIVHKYYRILVLNYLVVLAGRPYDGIINRKFYFSICWTIIIIIITIVRVFIINLFSYTRKKKQSLSDDRFIGRPKFMNSSDNFRSVIYMTYFYRGPVNYLIDVYNNYLYNMFL